MNQKSSVTQTPESVRWALTSDMPEATLTTDHEQIRKWVEERSGHPARVLKTGEGGVLRIDFDPPEEQLEAIGWDEFFEVFEDRELAFLHQDRTADGSVSRFNKLVDRHEPGR